MYREITIKGVIVAFWVNLGGGIMSVVVDVACGKAEKASKGADR